MRELLKVAVSKPLSDFSTKAIGAYEEASGHLALLSVEPTRRVFNAFKNEPHFADVALILGHREIDYLLDRSLVHEFSVHEITHLDLIAFSSPILRTQIKQLSDLAKPTIKRIAVAGPDTVESGFYLRRACMESDIWEEVAPKLIFTQSDEEALNLTTELQASVAISWESMASTLKRSFGLYRLSCFCALRKEAILSDVGMDFIEHMAKEILVRRENEC